MHSSTPFEPIVRPFPSFTVLPSPLSRPFATERAEIEPLPAFQSNPAETSQVMPDVMQKQVRAILDFFQQMRVEAQWARFTETILNIFGIQYTVQTFRFLY